MNHNKLNVVKEAAYNPMLSFHYYLQLHPLHQTMATN